MGEPCKRIITSNNIVLYLQSRCPKVIGTAQEVQFQQCEIREDTRSHLRRVRQEPCINDPLPAEWASREFLQTRVPMWNRTMPALCASFLHQRTMISQAGNRICHLSGGVVPPLPRISLCVSQNPALQSKLGNFSHFYVRHGS